MFRQITIYETDDGFHWAIEGWDTRDVDKQGLSKSIKRTVPQYIWEGLMKWTKEEVERLLKQLI